VCVGKSGGFEHLREYQWVSGWVAKIMGENAARNSCISTLKRLIDRTMADFVFGKIGILIIFDRINGLAEYYGANFKLSA
jgi:hypothetical protein